MIVRTSGPPRRLALIALPALLLGVSGCGGADPANSITVYCGRAESLVGPVVEAFQAATGIEVAIRYGGTADMAAQILEEGAASPADVFYGQDAGALGLLAKEGRLRPLPRTILDRVPAGFQDPGGLWVGTTGRARVIVYNTEMLTPDELPDTVDGLTDSAWRGRIGWAPTNGSFQSFVTAFRVMRGEEATRAWLEGMLANEPRAYPNNTAIYRAVADGEVEVGLSNHYYLYRFLAEEGESFAARAVTPKGGGPGALVNVSGGGVVDTAANPEAAERFLAYLLSDAVQERFVRETFEIPLVPGVETDGPGALSADESRPDLDFGDLDDLRGTLDLLRDVGAI